MIFNVSGGGGTALNFRVVGGTEAPANPAENCIWVNTEVDITSWIFSAEEPSPAEPGMVWIKVAASSCVPFNALKKNGVMVYPLSAEQYVDGAWVAVTATSYQGSAWVEWITYLYNRGDECTDCGGEWVSKAWKMSSDAGTTSQTYEITKNDDNMKFTKTGQIGAVMYKENAIDLTNVKAIHFKGELYCGSTERWAGFYVWSNMNGTYWDTNAAAKQLGTASTIATEFTLDVSTLEGEYYVGFGIYQTQNYVTVEELYLEVS